MERARFPAAQLLPKIDLAEIRLLLDSRAYSSVHRTAGRIASPAGLNAGSYTVRLPYGTAHCTANLLYKSIIDDSTRLSVA
jgi:hypothetical protein